MLKYALLGFLNYRVMTGYEIKAVMDQSISYFWHAELSQIYVTLKRLEKLGLVTSEVEPQESRPDRRVYTITEAGQRDLVTWLAAPLTDLIVKTKHPLLLKLFFARPIGKEALLAQLRVLLQSGQHYVNELHEQARQTVEQAAQEYPHLALDAILWEATRRYGERQTETILQWLEETINAIEIQFPD